ncbi:hypothetical protein EV360DRAFT_74292 [Lentinula raphanica]|nr:hypothetical protein EV360DRAFT_74292 [Lentinula raphanica]
MNDKQDNFHHLNSTTLLSSHLQPSTLVAVATIFLAGSAILWKSNIRLGNFGLLIKGSEQDQQAAALDDEHDPHDVHEGSNHNDGSKFHASRSKERRKRRKDPMKELLKGGKKAKDLAKLLKHVDLPGSNDPNPSSAPNSAQAAQEPSSSTIRLNRNRSVSRSQFGTRDPSVSFSSRSVSISSVAGESTRGGLSGDDFDDQDQEKDLALTVVPSSPTPHSEVNPVHSPTISYASTPLLAVSMFSMDSVNTADTSLQSANHLDLDPSFDEAGHAPLATSLPQPTSQNIRHNKNSNIKNSTDNLATNQLNIDNPDVSPAMLGPSQSMPSNAPSTQFKDKAEFLSTTLLVNTASSTSSRAEKPPRFRSQSRHEPALTSGVGIGFSTSMPIYSTVHAPGADTKLESDYMDGEPIGTGDHSPLSTFFSYPTLNASSGSVSANDSAPSSSKASSSAGVGTPPPSGSTNSTSLSTQTQIASLRGALEASKKREEETRGREEKTRSELERLVNELKVLRWEGNAWRRREGELQTQIQQLGHQLQSYSAYFAQPQFPHLQNLAIPQPQRASGKTSKAKRSHTQSRSSPASSRSTSKSSRPSRSSHASPIPPLTQLPESQTMSQGTSSPSLGSPTVPPSRMFSPSSTFSPGHFSTPFFPNAQTTGPFSPSSSFSMFSPTGSLGGMPFASPHIGMVSPLSPQSPYLPYPTYSAYGGFSQSQNQANGNGSSSNGAKMHPIQFLTMLNSNGKGNGTGTGSGAETGGTMSTSSTMSSLTTESTDSTSPELTMSPSPAPGPSRERGRKRGRGAMNGTGNHDRVLGTYGSEYQYGYSYGYPYPYPVPSPYHAYPGPGGMQGENGKDGEESSEARNSYDSDPGHDVDGEVNELLAGSILKRPESMMGLRRSGSGGSSKSKSTKASLRMSPMKDMELGDEPGDGHQLVNDGLGVTSPSSDSGVGLTQGLDWLHDPALFRHDSSDAVFPQRSEATMELTPMSMPSSPPQSDLSAALNRTTEMDFEAELSSSSSSASTKSNSESTSTTDSSDAPAHTPPMEFTFPSIATWGYSYRTHSAGDVEKSDINSHASVGIEAIEETEAEKGTMLAHDTETEEEVTPPVDKTNPLNVESRHLSSDTTITITSGPKNEHDQASSPDEIADSTQ